MAPGLENLKIVPFKVAAYNKTNQKMDYFNPSKIQDFEFISGTKMRHLARTGGTPPDGFMVPAAWEVLASYYRNLSTNK
jgi:3'-phosphoadenosine 5'-phosphosulfate synthase